jgi:hypothetical protein
MRPSHKMRPPLYIYGAYTHFIRTLKFETPCSSVHMHTAQKRNNRININSFVYCIEGIRKENFVKNMCSTTRRHNQIITSDIERIQNQVSRISSK